MTNKLSNEELADELETMYMPDGGDFLDEAAKRLRGEWISVEHRLPPPHTHVWCYNRSGHQFEGCMCYGMQEPFFTYPRGDGGASNTAPSWIDVTHWRPLPESPK